MADRNLPSRRRRVLAGASIGLVILTVVGSVALTDDEWPVAPFRMFSYANDPNGVVRAMSLRVDRTDGVSGFIGADHVGLRRAELEEQTPWNRRVPDDSMIDLVDTYDDRHDTKLRRLQVVVRTRQMRDGSPVGEETFEVIGEWIAPDADLDPTPIHLPEAEPWDGYTS